ncbi:MAG: hypothetical protein Q4F24_08150 [Eubacteriales bacterium]|nr:hypothetical protein [Eubacteriales bacterium]
MADYKFMFEGHVDDEESIKRCVSNILSVPKGSVPLSRGMGYARKCLSNNPPLVEDEIAIDIIEQIGTYEKRVDVDNVDFEYPGEGRVNVLIALREGDT